MADMNKIAREWLMARGVIEQFLSELQVFSYEPPVVKQWLEHNAAALLARLAAHDPPLLLVSKADLDAHTARVEYLEGKRSIEELPQTVYDRLRVDMTKSRNEIKRLTETLDAQHERERWLRAALERYGRHDGDCPMGNTLRAAKCDCGLDAVLAERAGKKADPIGGK